MRLILELQQSDGFTYDFTVTFPLVYESAEKAIVDLEALVKSTPKDKTIIFANHEFYVSDFYEAGTVNGALILPDIYTIDEWFDHYEKSLIKDEVHG